jgi:catechol 2,3-dioxygenase-like lactoylglutathione lyase family enzyme
VGYVFSPQGAGGNAALDSNPAGDGWTGTNALTSGQTNLTVDAGLYVPARIHGYAFMDDVYDLVRVPAQDGPVSNMLVWLLHNGVAIATNRTDANGFYQFTGIVPGTYTVLFDCNPPTLIAVPTEQPAASDPERNRAQSTTGSDAWIVHTVASGDGVLPGRFDEPLNAGFTGNPMAAAVNIVAYAGANGVVIEFTTDEEAGTHDIVLYAWLGGEWVEVARQAAVGEGSNRYAFDALPMLRSGQRYDFRIVDDEGRPHNVAGLEVAAFRAKAVRMVKDGVWIEFASLPDRTYDVYRASSPAAPDEAWTLVGTITAIERTTRTVVPVDPAARQGFFRVKMR